MKTSTKILLGLGGAIGLAIAWWLISPLFITNRVSEAIPAPVPTSGSSPASTSIPSVSPVATPSLEVLSQGTFTGFDTLHRASGTARLIRTDGRVYVRFEDDFTVTNGPDLFVYLGDKDKYDPNANLGRLKGNEGSQNYEIPSSIDLGGYSEVWVWCRAFSVPFGKAVLR